MCNVENEVVSSTEILLVLTTIFPCSEIDGLTLQKVRGTDASPIRFKKFTSYVDDNAHMYVADSVSPFAVPIQGVPFP